MVCVCVFFLSFARALYITETARDEGMGSDGMGGWKVWLCELSLNDQWGDE